MPIIKIDNTNFYYELHGKGAPLVLIAGYSCDHTFWKLVIAELAQRFQVLIFDNRGMGQTSDGIQPLSVEIMADDAMKLSQALGLVKPNILGHSMGGGIALSIAKKYQDEMNNLIIVNSAKKINNRSMMALQSFLRMLNEKVPLDTVIESSLPWFFSSEFLSSPQNVITLKEDLISNPYPPTINALQNQLKALSLFDSSEWVNQIKPSALVVASKEDIICTPAECEQLAQRLPNATLAYLPSGHSSPKETPNKLNDLISKFLQS